MKKLLIVAALFMGLSALASPEPTQRVLKAFRETFKSAKDITWHEYQDYCQANFTQDQMQIRAQYSDDGTLLRTIRYYGEDQLMPTIVAKLKKQYSGKEIYGVTETIGNDQVDFVINLKDDDNWYIVKSDIFGNLELADKFKRADK